MRQLEQICTEIYENFKERLRTSELLLDSVDAFHGNADWLVNGNEKSNQ